MNTRGEGMNLFRSIMSAWVGQKMVERSPLLQEIRSEINKLLLLVLLGACLSNTAESTRIWADNSQLMKHEY